MVERIMTYETVGINLIPVYVRQAQEKKSYFIDFFSFDKLPKIIEDLKKYPIVLGDTRIEVIDEIYGQFVSSLLYPNNNFVFEIVVLGSIDLRLE